jgi:hypothetical protein
VADSEGKSQDMILSRFKMRTNDCAIFEAAQYCESSGSLRRVTLGLSKLNRVEVPELTYEHSQHLYPPRAITDS